jgi:hypothetical protein
MLVISCYISISIFFLLYHSSNYGHLIFNSNQLSYSTQLGPSIDPLKVNEYHMM